MKRYRLHAEWPPNRGDVDRDARLIASVAGAAATTCPSLAPFVHGKRGETKPLREAQEWAVHLAESRETVELGEGVSASSARLDAVVPGRYGARRASLGGVLALEVRGAPDDCWIPNRIDLIVNADEVTRPDLDGLLRAIVRLLDPSWAFVGTERLPSAQPDREGLPIVGWLTYLSRPYGRPPAFDPKREPRVEVSTVDARGFLVRAFDDLPDEENDDHFAWIDAVRAALQASGSLRPYRDVLRDPRRDEVRVAAPEISREEPALAAAVRAPVHDVPPPPPVRPKIVAALDSTAPGGSAVGAAPLPFTPAQATPPARKALEPRLGSELGETAPIGAKKPEGAALPFRSEARLDVNQFAALYVELSQAGANRAHVLSRYAIRDESDLARIQAEFRTRFDSDPALYGQWAGLVSRMRELLSRR